MPEGPIPYRSCLIDTAMHICILTRPGHGFSVNHVYSSLLGPSLKVPRSSEGRIRAQSFLLCFILYRSCIDHHVLSRERRLPSATPELRYIHHLRSVFNPSPVHMVNPRSKLTPPRILEPRTVSDSCADAALLMSASFQQQGWFSGAEVYGNHASSTGNPQWWVS
jgi:hypothetical protein